VVAAAAADNSAFESQPADVLACHLDFAAAKKSCVASRDLDALVLGGCREPAVESFGGAMDPLGGGGGIDGQWLTRDAWMGSLPGALNRMQNGLCRNTRLMQARAAEGAAWVNQRDLAAQLGRAEGTGVSGWAAAKNDHICVFRKFADNHRAEW
jgi:hypothetical protein